MGETFRLRDWSEDDGLTRAERRTRVRSAVTAFDRWVLRNSSGAAGSMRAVR
jgi:hypothetical protein